jgi:hypothetical protein
MMPHRAGVEKFFTGCVFNGVHLDTVLKVKPEDENLLDGFHDLSA